MNTTVADIIKIMETLAPSRLAEEWDNPGLQVGSVNWPVKRLSVALDPTPDVVANACKRGIDLLITHHPLIFRPLTSLDISTPAGAIIHEALQHQLAIFAAHTNLDYAVNGLNDLLGSKIGLKNLNVMGRAIKQKICKLVFYVPPEYEQNTLDALFQTDAGRIGEYSCCSFRNKGKGSFRPGTSAKPFMGEAGVISHVDEVRIELVAPKREVAGLIKHVREIHPYETMAYDVYPLWNSTGNIQNVKEGAGRIGELEKETELAAFAQRIKETLGLDHMKMAGRPDMPVRKVAICTGSGSGLMKAFFSSAADVYVSGDLRYHDARDAEAAGKGLIDIGHFASEHILVNILAERLSRILNETGTRVQVEAYERETDPFIPV